MEVRETSGRFASTWVVPQDGFKSCPKYGAGLFLMPFDLSGKETPYETLYETMAELGNRSRIPDSSFLISN